MKPILYLSSSILLLFLPRTKDYFALSWSFAPAPSAAKTVRLSDARKPAARALQYKTKDQDAIAHEIIDIEGGESAFRKPTSHDHNPWKALLRSNKAKSPDGPTELVELVRPGAVAKAATVESLRQDLFSLFQIAQQLTATELELVNQMTDMEKERDSIRWLARRIFVLLKDRLVRRVRRLFRFGKKKAKEGSK
jgi:hypothetical protein